MIKSNESLKFSIIICAHNRTKYLVSAMKSSLEQDFPRENYEVILVRNFKDKRIDNYTAKNGIIDILTEKGPLMQKMLDGLENAKGEYICFLEDDDLFGKNKLKRIDDLIKKHKSLSFYHNSFTPMDENGKTIGQDISRTAVQTMIFKGEQQILAGFPAMLRLRADWYGSMMCIRKDALNLCMDLLRKIEGSADKIIFYTGLLDSGTIILDSEKTTQYRFHQSHTTILADYVHFISKKNAFYQKSLESAMILEKICSGSYLENISKCYVLHEQLLARLTTQGKTGKIISIAPEVMECYKKTGLKNIFLWYFLLIAKEVFGKSIMKLYYIMSSSFSRKITST